MWLAGVIIGCVGGYIVVAVRQDERGPLKSRLAGILGYLLIVVGLGLFIAGMWR
jgi:sulfite exporter TauE/SafE